MKTILVAVQGRRLGHVVDEAVVMARVIGAKISLLHVVPVQPEIPITMWAVPPEGASRRLLESGRRVLSELAKTIPEDLRGDMLVEVGVAWRCICSIARDHHVDVVVVGADGPRLLERLVGTTAARVVDNCDCTVLVVRAKAEAA